MQVTQLIRLGWQRAVQELRENAYLKTGLDLTRPYAIRGLLTRRCNHHCPFCGDWRQDGFPDEMTADEWCTALESLKRFIGRYTVQFSGGEPSLHPGFFEVLEFCRERGIGAGVVSNGSFLKGEKLERFVQARPTSLDISVDGPDSALHDMSRNTMGSFETIESGIRRLRMIMQDEGRVFPIRIKTTVHRKNFRALPQLVTWSKRCGAATISFQPVRRWTPEVAKKFWLEEEELNDLAQVVETLIALRKAGAAIETPPEKMADWPAYFRHETTDPGVRPCRVGLGDYHIQANGDVMMCWLQNPIGNVKHQEAWNIWGGESGRSLRRATLECPKFGHEDCAHSCLARRPFREEVKRGLMVLRGARQKTDDRGSDIRVSYDNLSTRPGHAVTPVPTLGPAVGTNAMPREDQSRRESSPGPTARSRPKR